MKAKIERKFGLGMLRKSALRLPGGEEALREALEGKGYRTVLEIGTFIGCTAAAMSQYCKRVVTIDLVRGKLEQDGSRFDRMAFWKELGISNIEFKAVKDDVEKASVIAGLAFDFAFIDGAHDAAGVRKDFALVKRCGTVLFHDYDPSGRPGKQHVFEFVNALPAEEVRILGGVFALWTEQP